MKKSRWQLQAEKILKGKILSEARLAKKGIHKFTAEAEQPEISQTYLNRQKRISENRKARLSATPKKYKRAILKYGSGRADSIIKQRGTYYAGAALYQIQKNKLKIRKTEIAGRHIDVQNVYSWKNAAGKKGWIVRSINGKPEKKLIRYAQARREQRAAFKAEKIRVFALKTGKTQKEIKQILTTIREQENRKLKNYRRSKKFKSLTKKEQRKQSINRRMQAIFGAMCDILEIHGSPK